jgi:plasmid maintenance system killer protein
LNFLIAASFTDSLARLTAQEQKAVKTTAFDLQMDASAPGLSFHKLDRAVDKNFWSVRVNADIRLIVHRGDASLLLAYVDHHDKAYRWAERRKIERHPTTGAMQLVEVRERVEDLVVRPKPPSAAPEPKLFAGLRKLEIIPAETKLFEQSCQWPPFRTFLGVVGHRMKTNIVIASVQTIERIEPANGPVFL